MPDADKRKGLTGYQENIFINLPTLQTCMPPHVQPGSGAPAG